MPDARIGIRVEATNAAGPQLAAAGREVDKLGRSASAAEPKIGLLGKAGPLLKAGLVGAAVAAAAAIVKLGLDSVKSGSDLEQAMGGAAAVFGRDVGQINEAAAGAAEGVGLAKSQYLDLATVLGAGLKNQGIKDFAGQTDKVIGLGADLAAQFGGSTKEAVEAIGSLMRGEADPIEKYGVGIKQSAVNAELAAKGQDKLTGAARTQAEAQARLSLLFKQTASAQGAFSRESNTLAGQQQRLAANTEDLKAKIGQALLPAITAVVGFFNQAVTGSGRVGAAFRAIGAVIVSIFAPPLRALGAGLQDLKGKLTQAAGGSDNVRNAVTKAGPVLAQVAKVIGIVLGGAIKVVVFLIGGLIRVIGFLAQKAAVVTVATIRFGQALARTPTGQAIFAAIRSGIDRVSSAARVGANVVRAIGSAISAVRAGLFSVIASSIDRVRNAAASARGVVVRIGQAISAIRGNPFGPIAAGIDAIRSAAYSAIGALGSLAAKIASTPIGKAAGAIGGLFRSEAGGFMVAPESGRRIVIQTQVTAPTVILDGASLRAIIRAEVRSAVRPVRSLA